MGKGQALLTEAAASGICVALRGDRLHLEGTNLIALQIAAADVDGHRVGRRRKIAELRPDSSRVGMSEGDGRR